MPLGYEYKRYFIILQEEEKGYEIAGGKIPTGYVKIEIKKGKIKITGFVQNVITNEKSDYKLFLLAPKEMQAIELGRLRMDNNGKGEFSRELDLENVLESSMDITEFSSALVTSGDRVILFGYSGREKMEWKEWFYNKYMKKEIEEIPRLEEIQEMAKVKEIEKDIIENEDVEPIRQKEIVEEFLTKDDEELIRHEEITEEFLTKDDEESIRHEEITEEFLTNEEEKEPLDHDVVEETIKEELPFDHYFHPMDKINTELKYPRKDYSKGKKYKKLARVLESLEEIDGIEGMDKQRWFIIGNKLYLLNSIIINLNGTKMPLSYPYFAEGCGPWIKNSILGIEYDDGDIKKVFIGLPGTYKTHWESYFEMKGFTKYKKAKKSKRGFWMMCIDLDKGKLCKM